VIDGKHLFDELWAFYRQLLSPEGMSALDFAQLVTYLLFLEIDDERSRRPVNRVQVVPDGLGWQSLVYKNGSVLEDQFRGYFEEAERTRGITGVTLLQLLERRLDNVVYRLGLATSRPQARQLVRHGHFLVNGKKVDIPSFSVKEGDVITVLGRTQKNPTIEHAMEEVKGRGIPEWLSFDQNTITGRVNAMPTREQINLPVQEQLIVELYSK